MPVMSLEHYILNVFLGLHSKRTTALLSKKNDLSNKAREGTSLDSPVYSSFHASLIDPKLHLSPSLP